MSAIVLSLLPHALALQPCQRWSTASAPRRASATIVANTGVVTDVATADSKYDIVVIGSGIGGLSTAALLASTGQKVAVCESHDAPGARGATTRTEVMRAGSNMGPGGQGEGGAQWAWT